MYVCMCVCIYIYISQHERSYVLCAYIYIYITIHVHTRIHLDIQIGASSCVCPSFRTAAHATRAIIILYTYTHKYTYHKQDPPRPLTMRVPLTQDSNTPLVPSKKKSQYSQGIPSDLHATVYRKDFASQSHSQSQSDRPYSRGEGSLSLSKRAATSPSFRPSNADADRLCSRGEGSLSNHDITSPAPRKSHSGGQGANFERVLSSNHDHDQVGSLRAAPVGHRSDRQTSASGDASRQSVAGRNSTGPRQQDMHTRARHMSPNKDVLPESHGPFSDRPVSSTRGYPGDARSDKSAGGHTHTHMRNHEHRPSHESSPQRTQTQTQTGVRLPSGQTHDIIRPFSASNSVKKIVSDRYASRGQTPDAARPVSAITHNRGQTPDAVRSVSASSVRGGTANVVSGRVLHRDMYSDKALSSMSERNSSTRSGHTPHI
jgi:hypothetical protein